jgi:hypothetical protein
MLHRFSDRKNSLPFKLAPYLTARLNCIAWLAGTICGLVAPSTSAQGPFAVGAACSLPSNVTVTVPSLLFTMLSVGASGEGLPGEKAPVVS